MEKVDAIMQERKEDFLAKPQQQFLLGRGKDNLGEEYVVGAPLPDPPLKFDNLNMEKYSCGPNVQSDAEVRKVFAVAKEPLSAGPYLATVPLIPSQTLHTGLCGMHCNSCIKTPSRHQTAEPSRLLSLLQWRSSFIPSRYLRLKEQF